MGRSGAKISCWRCCAAFAVVVAAPRCVDAAQTVAPLAEWQYSGGVLLDRMDQPEVPQWSVQVGGGVMAGPRYEGSGRTSLELDPLIEVRYRDLAFASLGEGVGVNLFSTRRSRAGVAITADLGRKDSDDRRLRGLGDVNAAPELKLFAETILFPVTLRVDVRRGLGGHDGWIGDLSAYVPVLATEHAAVLVGPSVTVANRRWMRAYFGVDGEQSADSGLAPYAPDGGFASASLGVTAAWAFSTHWFVELLGASRYAFDPIAHSPITRQRNQLLAALYLGYDF